MPEMWERDPRTTSERSRAAPSQLLYPLSYFLIQPALRLDQRTGYRLLYGDESALDHH
jgi:hypothetical protein